MAPLPKRRHSSRRSGKREQVSLLAVLSQKNKCPKCGGTKMTHRICASCGFYK